MAEWNPGMELQYECMFQNLNMDKSTVCRTIQLFYSTGTVSKRDYPKESAARKLSNPAQLFILHLVIKQPSIYLYEIQSELSDLLGIEVSISTTFRFLHENGFTRQKLQITAVQRDDSLRQQYVSDYIYLRTTQRCSCFSTRLELIPKMQWGSMGTAWGGATCKWAQLFKFFILSSIALLGETPLVTGGWDTDALPLV